MKLRVTVEVEIKEMPKETQRELKRYCPAMEDDLFDPRTYSAEELASCVILPSECMGGTDVFVDFSTPKVIGAEIVDE